MEHFKIIAFTHANVGLEKVASFFIPEDSYKETFSAFKERMQLDEFMFLSTCNRTEFMFKTSADANNHFLRDFYSSLYPNWETNHLDWAVSNTVVLDGLDAVRHMFHVAGSLDSLVVGEREIITQFRKSYDKFHSYGLTGDFLRIAERKTIETAKQIFTETDIANRPVSVVNLAYRTLKDHYVPVDARVLVIGAGVTNSAMLRKMKKHGFTNFTIYNRTFGKAEELAKTVNGVARPLTELENHSEGFDVMLTCTGAPHEIVTEELYAKLLNGDTTLKYVVDLAVPNDFSTSIKSSNPVELIEVESLKEIAAKNLQERKKSLVRCEEIVDQNLSEFKNIYQERLVELAMKDVPTKVKEIKERAINEVFSKDLEELDVESRELLQEIIAYMEKKYISVPMKMAKEIILDVKK